MKEDEDIFKDMDRSTLYNVCHEIQNRLFRSYDFESRIHRTVNDIYFTYKYNPEQLVKELKDLLDF